MGIGVAAGYAGYAGPGRTVISTVGDEALNKPDNFRDGDWMCPSCNSHNYAARYSCRDCKTNKPDSGSDSRGRYSRDDRSHGRNKRSQSRSRSRSRDRSRRSRSRSRSRSRDRGNRDRGDRERDNTCYAFQRGECTRGDSCRFEHTRGSSRTNGNSLEHEPRRAIRSGDWFCNCNSLKYAFRDTCTTCNSQRNETAEAKAIAFLEYVRRKNLPAKFLPNDWVCPNCQEHVFARKQKCGKCESDRPSNPDPELVTIFGESFFQNRSQE